jgi:hypothetical protein
VKTKALVSLGELGALKETIEQSNGGSCWVALSVTYIYADVAQTYKSLIGGSLLMLCSLEENRFTPRCKPFQHRFASHLNHI